MPEFMMANGQTGVLMPFTIPMSNYWSTLLGGMSEGYSPIGPPIIGTDDSVYIEYEIRDVGQYVVNDASLWLLKFATDGTQTNIQLDSTTSDENLLPGKIIPDGQGGVLATWWVSADSDPKPDYPFRGVQVDSSGRVGTPYNLPISISLNNVSTGYDSNGLAKVPSLVLGENNTVYASYNTGVVSFDLTSGTSNWNYQAPVGATLVLIAATHDGRVAVSQNTGAQSQPGILWIDSAGTPTYDASTAGSAMYYSDGYWIGNIPAQGASANDIKAVSFSTQSEAQSNSTVGMFLGSFMMEAFTAWPFAGGDRLGSSAPPKPAISIFEPGLFADGLNPNNLLKRYDEDTQTNNSDLSTVTTLLPRILNGATYDAYVKATGSKPIDAVAFVGHALVPDKSLAIGLCFWGGDQLLDCRLDTADANIYWDKIGVTQTDPTTGQTLQMNETKPWYTTQARILFIGACNVTPNFQSYFDITGDSSRALVVPNSSTEVPLQMAEFEWVRIVYWLMQKDGSGKSLPLDEAVGNANNDVSSHLFFGLDNKPYPSVQWTVVGNNNVHF